MVIRSILSVLATLLILEQHVQAVEIDNVRSGLVCGTNEEAEPIRQPVPARVCYQTEEVYITGQATCELNGKSIPCTWYGFEFDYSGLAEDEIITCRSQGEFLSSFGDPQQIIASDVIDFEYTLGVPKGDGHFFNPQYTAFMYRPVGFGREETRTTCYSGETELFSFDQTLILPEWAD